MSCPGWQDRAHLRHTHEKPQVTHANRGSGLGPRLVQRGRRGQRHDRRRPDSHFFMPTWLVSVVLTSFCGVVAGGKGAKGDHIYMGKAREHRERTEQREPGSVQGGDGVRRKVLPPRVLAVGQLCCLVGSKAGWGDARRLQSASTAWQIPRGGARRGLTKRAGLSAS